jgi:hypothetical protein
MVPDLMAEHTPEQQMAYRLGVLRTKRARAAVGQMVPLQPV